jgi:Xaa-Pro dipeptidase
MAAHDAASLAGQSDPDREQDSPMVSASKSPFSREEYITRVEMLREKMNRLNLDAIVVSAPENIVYLCGYNTKAVFTFQFLILHKARPAHLITRQMEATNARRACETGLLDGYTLYQDDEDPIAAAATAIQSHVEPGGRVGMEFGSWTMPAQRAQDITRNCPSITWQDVTSTIDRQRLVKSPAELAVLKDAAAITDRITDKACAAISSGRTEDDIAQVVMAELIAAGSEYPGSWPNIMAGRRTGLIHAAWEGEVIGTDDHVLMEITGVQQRYHAPCLRTVMVGKPADNIRHAAAILTEAHAAALAAIEPGRPARVINQAAQAVLAQQDAGCKLSQRSGYSLGIGYPPSWGAQWQLGLNSLVEETLQVGMTFHVVLVGHFPDGRAVGVGCTAALLEDGVARWTKGGVFEVPN